MKTLPRTPFFETGVKNYIYGDAVIEYAKMADAAAEKYDVDVIFISPYTEIRTICEHTTRLFVFAPYMDAIRPGRGIADVLPDAIKAAGATGVVLNHCEKPVTLNSIRQTMERAHELELITFLCADSVAEAKAVAQFQPDIINPEPTELIGTTSASNMDYVRETLRAIKSTFPDILVEQAAGITTARQVFDFIMAGNDGAGSASGILKSPKPFELLDEMIGSVRAAKDMLRDSTH